MTPQFLVSLITLLVFVGLLLGATAYLILLERKIAAWVQDRVGPNRVGFHFGLPFMPKFHFWGLGQPLADGLKMFFKEDYTPAGVDKPLFILAPILMVMPALLGWAIIPWGGSLDVPALSIFGWQICAAGRALVAGLNVDIGVVYVLAIGSVAVYGVVVGAYASNNKYSFLGGLRATAQMLSYEIPLGISVLAIILMTGSPRADLIMNLQAAGGWNIVYQPLLAVIFFTCNLAETNRAPFDLAEAEQELVGGYHTEYSSMKFALFLLAEYIHLIAAAAFFALLFLGGGDLPFFHNPLAGSIGWVLLRVAVYLGKVFVLICLAMLVRWTLPRFRFDQLMRLAWRGLIPVTLALLLVTGALEFLVVLGKIDRSAAHWLMLVGNIAVALIAIIIGPFIPAGAPGNRRVSLAGSRFSPPTTA